MTLIPLVYHASYSKLALPPHHRFPTTKYAHLRQYLLDNHIATTAQFHAPTAMTAEDVMQVHQREYVGQFIAGTLPTAALRRIGFPWSEALVERTLHSVAGTTLTASLAINQGIALHLTGGYHHAHYDFGSGYCIFNDLILAARNAIASHQVHKVLIFDCDVHQGDGSATLSHQHQGIISCSIHCKENFPNRKQHSHYDIELTKGSDDNLYLETVEQTLALLIRIHQPDLILYDAGVDIHQNDDLGLLNISQEGLFRRDLTVLSMAKSENIPIAAVIGGGYSRDALQLSQRHCQLFIAANHLW
ncbi:MULTISPECIES: histone deacetylase [unclassified Shewanella]|uniref:histone deacetylase family protein n=1 Tax=unclassified Shewanella TaxID=196818 RepID=UPI0021D97EA2|nr:MULTISPECIES: histone deacetylase [unclassified Shewanella]MCU8034196.1 histone deacetylase [Shewanella sp. SM71]MCU8095083.1 histone deacetylase [Shewanella sp. SM102]